MSVIKKFPDGFLVREATLQDKQEVVTSFDVYDGFDYVEHLYEHFMNHTNISCYVAELDGNIICFTYLLVVDEDKAVVTGGKRTRADYQGRGYQKRFEEAVNSYIQAQLDYKLTWKYTAVCNPYNDLSLEKLKVKVNITNFAKRNFRSYAMNIDSLRELVQTKAFLDACSAFGTEDAKKIHTLSQCSALFGDESNTHSLYPHGTVIVDWIPFKVLPSNFRYILDISTCHVSAAADGKKTLNALSFMRKRLCKAGVMFGIDIYTDSTLPKEKQCDLMFRHILNLVSSIVQTSYTNGIDIHVHLYLPLDLDMAIIEDKIADIFGWEFDQLTFKEIMTCSYEK